MNRDVCYRLMDNLIQTQLPLENFNCFTSPENVLGHPRITYKRQADVLREAFNVLSKPGLLGVLDVTRSLMSCGADKTVSAVEATTVPVHFVGTRCTCNGESDLKE